MKPNWSHEDIQNELRSNNKDNNKLLILNDGKIYDVTKWSLRHPGGSLIMRHYNGIDATDQMKVFHPPNILEKLLPKFHIANLDKTLGSCCTAVKKVQVDPNTVNMKEASMNLASDKMTRISTTPVSIAFREFDVKLHEDGFYDIDCSFYYYEAVKLVIIFTLCISILLYNPSSIACVCISTVLMAFLWQQVAFIAHDAGHNGITGVLAHDHLIGIFLGNLLGGVSIGWWKHSHNIHHVVPNDPNHDPDIQHMPFLAISNRFFTSLYSSYHKRIMFFDLFSRFFVQLQHHLFYLLMSLGRLNLYIESLKYLATHPEVRNPALEISALVVFWCWYSYLLSFIPSIPLRCLYVLLSNTLVFILHLQITLSHMGMEVVPIYENEEEFIRSQLRATLDIKCSPWLDWFHGGLQFQAIHHLFPRLPRRNLRKVQARTIAFCKDHGIVYKTMSFLSVNLLVVSKLKVVAQELTVLLNPKFKII